MTQVAHWVEGAGQTITINNLTNWYVQYHYREADMNVETDRIRAHYGVWNQYKNIWPNNTETNPWYEPMMALLGEAGVTEGQEPCQPQETTTTTVVNSDERQRRLPTGPIRYWDNELANPPLNVGQTISYLEAALIGNPQVRRDGSSQHKHLGGRSQWPSWCGKSHFTEPEEPRLRPHFQQTRRPSQYEFMLTPIGPDLLPGMTITPFMSVQIAQETSATWA